MLSTPMTVIIIIAHPNYVLPHTHGAVPNYPFLKRTAKIYTGPDGKPPLRALSHLKIILPLPCRIVKSIQTTPHGKQTSFARATHQTLAELVHTHLAYRGTRYSPSSPSDICQIALSAGQHRTHSTGVPMRLSECECSHPG